MYLHVTRGKGPEETGVGVRPQAMPILRAEQASGGCFVGTVATLGWATVLTSQWPVLVVQGLRQVLNSEIMLVT